MCGRPDVPDRSPVVFCRRGGRKGVHDVRTAIVGELSPEECAAGGRWLVGDRLPVHHHGWREDLCYKSWVALPDRYGPGLRPLVDRGAEGWVEYVQVFTGRLDLLQEAGGQCRRAELAYPQDVWLSPTLRRRWELPAGCERATGATVLLKMPSDLCASDSPVFCSWDETRSSLLSRESAESPDWCVHLVEVFQGTVRWRPNRQYPSPVSLTPGMHVFLPRRFGGTWELVETPARGISLFF